MKNKLLRDKFKKNHVKPLYRKANPKNAVVSILSTCNLDGSDFTVEKEISNVVNGAINHDRKKQNSILPEACERTHSKALTNRVYNLRNNELKRFRMVDSAGNSKPYDSRSKEKVNQLVQSDKLRPQNVSYLLKAQLFVLFSVLFISIGTPVYFTFESLDMFY